MSATNPFRPRRHRSRRPRPRPDRVASPVRLRGRAPCSSPRRSWSGGRCSTSLVLAAPAVARTASPRGRRVVLVGCALQISFATLYGATALRRRAPRGVVRGVHARLHRSPRGRAPVGLTAAADDRWRLAAVGLLAVAALGALAMLVGSDPFHDIFLVSSYAAWVVVGPWLRLAPGRPHPPGRAGHGRLRLEPGRGRTRPTARGKAPRSRGHEAVALGQNRSDAALAPRVDVTRGHCAHGRVHSAVSALQGDLRA